MRRRRYLSFFCILAAFASSSLHALELYKERSSPTDLAIRGRLTGLPAGELRYLRWAELRALPVTTLKVDGEFVRGEQEVTVLFIRDLLKLLPLAEGADTLLAECKDHYASVYTQAFIENWQPFLVLEINGQGPDKWPPPGLKFNPGPYVITASDVVVPGVSKVLDIGHKKPWGTVTIELANYAERFGGGYKERWSDLSPAARQGREIWVNSCSSCHVGPGGMFGGNKSERPFMVVEAIAGYNRDYFKKYVGAPASMNPAAKMEAHPHYSEAQLDALIAFITADGKK